MRDGRVAISVDSEKGLEAPVALHFGRCPFFTVVDVQDGEVNDVRSVENPFFAAHEPGQVPSFIASLGAHVMLSGGMGGRAAEIFAQLGIEAATGASGSARAALAAYLGNEISGVTPCEHQ